MATFVGKISDDQIIFIAAVSASGGRTKSRRYEALLDTGAQTTMISTKVVRETGLKAVGNMEIIPVTGNPILAEKYMVRLDIPIDSAVLLPGGKIGRHDVVRGMDIEVGKIPYDPVDYDVLLGMDFISEFHITMYGGNYILSN